MTINSAVPSGLSRYWLAAGDAYLSDAVQLDEQSAGSWVAFDGDVRHQDDGKVIMDIWLEDNSSDAALRKWARIESYLLRAAKGASPYRHGLPVVFIEQTRDASEWTYRDVLEGSKLEHKPTPEVSTGRAMLRGTLILNCLRYGRSTPLVTDFGSTLTNDGSAALHLFGTPGTAEGLCELRIRTTTPVAKFRIGQRSDLVLYHAQTPTFISLTGSVTTSPTWQRMGSAVVTGRGLYDVWMPTTDSGLVLSPPRITGAQNAIGGELPPGARFTYTVTPYDGSHIYGTPSRQVTLSTPLPLQGATDLKYFTWDSFNTGDIQNLYPGPVGQGITITPAAAYGGSAFGARVPAAAALVEGAPVFPEDSQTLSLRARLRYYQDTPFAAAATYYYPPINRPTITVTDTTAMGTSNSTSDQTQSGSARQTQIGSAAQSQHQSTQSSSENRTDGSGFTDNNTKSDGFSHQTSDTTKSHSVATSDATSDTGSHQASASHSEQTDAHNDSTVQSHSRNDASSQTLAPTFTETSSYGVSSTSNSVSDNTSHSSGTSSGTQSQTGHSTSTETNTPGVGVTATTSDTSGSSTNSGTTVTDSTNHGTSDQSSPFSTTSHTRSTSSSEQLQISDNTAHNISDSSGYSDNKGTTDGTSHQHTHSVTTSDQPSSQEGTTTSDGHSHSHVDSVSQNHSQQVGLAKSDSSSNSTSSSESTTINSGHNLSTDASTSDTTGHTTTASFERRLFFDTFGLQLQAGAAYVNVLHQDVNGTQLVTSTIQVAGPFVVDSDFHLVELTAKKTQSGVSFRLMMDRHMLGGWEQQGATLIDFRQSGVDVDDVAGATNYIGGGILAGGSVNDLSWDPSRNASGYVVSWQWDDSPYQNLDVGNARAFTHVNPQPDGTFITALLPQQTSPAVDYAQLRPSIGGGTAPLRMANAPIVRTAVAGGVEELVHLGTLPLPPGGSAELRLDDVPQTTIALDARAGSATTGTLSCRGLYFFPVDHAISAGSWQQLTATASGLDGRAVEWRIGTDRWGRSYARLYDLDTGVFVGYADASGAIGCGPGETWFTLLAESEVAPGVFSPDPTLQFTVATMRIPRWGYIGAPGAGW